MIAEALEHHAEVHGETIALRDDDDALTFRELRGAVSIAREWLENTFDPGARLMVDARPRIAFVVLVLAAHLSDRVPYPVSASASDTEIQNLTMVVRPKALIGRSSKSLPSFSMPKFTAGSLSRVTSVTPIPLVSSPEQITLGMLTSGSTGLPKMLTFTQSQVGFLVTAISSRLEYRTGDVVYCALPLSFDYGYYQMLLTLTAGAQLVLSSNRAVGANARRLDNLGVTVLPVVPTLLRAYLVSAARSTNRPHLRLVTSTGEPFSAALQMDLAALHPDTSVALMYGLTECKRVSITVKNAQMLPCDHVGAPLDGTTVIILDEQGRRVGCGVHGEIAVAGPHISLDSTLDARGCLLTGDRGWLDEEGFVHVIDRIDNEQLKINGVRTSRREIELAALRISGVVQAVCGVAPSTGEVALWIAGDVKEDAVRRGLLDQLDALKVPRIIEVRYLFPPGVNGKFNIRTERDR